MDQAKPPTRAPTAEPSPSLTDAVNAFTNFNAVLDGYLAGSTPITAFESIVTPEYFDVLVEEDVDGVTKNGTRTVGASSFGEEKLVEPEDWGGYGDVALVVCRDISRTSEVDRNGEPVGGSGRDTLIPLVVYFTVDNSPERRLLVTKVDQWNEDGYCT